MGYAKKLQRKFAVTQRLIDGKEFGLLRKRRDKVSERQCLAVQKQSAEFRTAVGAKQKTKGSSKQPKGWYTAGQFAR